MPNGTWLRLDGGGKVNNEFSNVDWTTNGLVF
jgi:hypothetical protein